MGNDDPGVITPLILSSFVLSGVGAGSATLSWTTNIASSTKIVYGVYPNYGQKTVETNTLGNLVTSHTVTLTGLTPGAIYRYKIESREAGGRDGMNNPVMDGYRFEQLGTFVAA